MIKRSLNKHKVAPQSSNRQNVRLMEANADLILKVVGEVDFSDVFGIDSEQKSDRLLTAVLEVAEELNHLLLVILSWLLTDHDPLLDYHLYTRGHLRIMEYKFKLEIKPFQNQLYDKH